jgi:hypothetical protein
LGQTAGSLDGIGREGKRVRQRTCFAVVVFPSPRREQRSEGAAQINNKAWDVRRETMYYCVSKVDISLIGMRLIGC